MGHVYINKIKNYENQEVTLKGWLYNKRSSGKLHFLQVRDGYGIIQCVVSKADVGDEIFETATRIAQESSIIVTGTVKKDERSPLGFELIVKDLKEVGTSKDYPIAPKEHGVNFLLEQRHLWIRSKMQTAILRIRSAVFKAIYDFFDERDFVHVSAPIFTPSACEGTTTLFEVEYFGEKAYLTQSGQLYSEATSKAFGKVFCFGPAFRAEKSKTRRHLTEFWMVEPEVAYATHEENMDLAEDFIVYIVERVLERCQDELKTLERDISKLESIKKPFPRLHYKDAVKLIQQQKPDFPYGEDFGGEDETILSTQFDRPVMVHHYPSEIKAFYMKKDPNEPEFAQCVDVLASEGYGEIIGGGSREDNLDVLLGSIKKHGLPEEAFEWYLDLRKYGTTPSAGFGLGVERTVAWICGIKHIRETIPFPRMLERIYP